MSRWSVGRLVLAFAMSTAAQADTIGFSISIWIETGHPFYCGPTSITTAFPNPRRFKR